jgi:hypothetical protein
MLLRISLIIAILAALGAAGVTHFKVGPMLTELNTTLAETKTNLETTQASERKLKTDLTKTKGDLEKTSKDLAQTTVNFEEAQGKAKEQQKRADKSAAELERTLLERNEARSELAAYKAAGVPVDKITEAIEKAKQLELEREALAQENTVLARNNVGLQARLKKYEGPDHRIAMPGLKGKIIAIDPKWNFVVLDVGQTQGALEDGELIVNRDGKLVSKLRITNVQPNRSVANVLPEWRQTDVMEGDQVLY